MSTLLFAVAAEAAARQAGGGWAHALRLRRSFFAHAFRRRVGVGAARAMARHRLSRVSMVGAARDVLRRPALRLQPVVDARSAFEFSMPFRRLPRRGAAPELEGDACWWAFLRPSLDLVLALRVRLVFWLCWVVLGCLSLCVAFGLSVVFPRCFAGSCVPRCCVWSLVVLLGLVFLVGVVCCCLLLSGFVCCWLF